MSDTESMAVESPETFTESNIDDKMAEEDPDKFAEEIIETGVIRKTVKRSYIIQEVSI